MNNELPFTHSYPFDPTHGYVLPDLQRVSPAKEAEDFSDFWKQTYAETQTIPLRIARRPVKSKNVHYDLWEVEFDSWESMRIGAWIAVPRDGIYECGFIHGHGYGSSISEVYEPPGPKAVTLTVCKRGLGRSQQAPVPNAVAEHVLYGIASKETYIHRGCVADVWCATRVLCELYPEVKQRLYYQGSSFGGGIGALAIPWEPAFKKAFLGVPTFGNHPLRLTLPCVGSGQSLQCYGKNHPEIVNVLAYFDASVAAAYIQIPTFMSCALFDPSVPPAGQFAVYNAMRCRKKLYILPAAHFEYPNQAKVITKMHREIAQWFSE